MQIENFSHHFFVTSFSWNGKRELYTAASGMVENTSNNERNIWQIHRYIQLVEAKGFHYELRIQPNHVSTRSNQSNWCIWDIVSFLTFSISLILRTSNNGAFDRILCYTPSPWALTYFSTNEPTDSIISAYRSSFGHDSGVCLWVLLTAGEIQKLDCNLRNRNSLIIIFPAADKSGLRETSTELLYDGWFFDELEFAAEMSEKGNVNPNERQSRVNANFETTKRDAAKVIDKELG